jgi:hypothetical protein
MGHRFFGPSVLFLEVFLLRPEVPINYVGQGMVQVDSKLRLFLEVGEDVESLFQIAFTWRCLILR